ncbi:MAG: hypothetical protein PHT53_01180 [Candidatus Omnitrophica bacterium]|nr:hypothetical protein [Candidatus Omnitrophota bacterium]
MAKEKFTDYLIDNKLISKEDLEKALSAQKEKGGSLVELFVKLGIMQEVQIISILSGYLSVPPMRVLNLNVTKEILDLIPEKIASSLQVMPIGKIGNTITVAMSDPLNVLAIDDLKKITGCEINPVIAPFSEMKETIAAHYSRQPLTSLEDIIGGQRPENLEIISDKEAIEEEIGSIDEAPVIKFTNSVLKKAVYARASDILIEPLEKTSRVRFRID